MTEERYAPPEELTRIRQRALAAGAVASAACVVGAILTPVQFFRSYLVGYVWVLSIALGAFAISMLHHMTRGAWGVMIRRILEAASRTFPLLAVLFVPIALGTPTLYDWARPDLVEKDPLLLQKAAYLNPLAFLIRAAIYFALWIVFASILSRLSRRQDEAGDPTLTRRMQYTSSGGIVVYCLTMTLAAVDWMMSLNPHWASTIYGLYIIIGQVIGALSFAVLVALFLSTRAPMAGAFRPNHFHDYGKLLLAFVMVWAYFAVSQFLIVWSGNLPEETTWYQGRMHGGWRWVSLLLVFLHFAFPFVLLLSRDLKRDARKLARVAVLLLVMRWVDLYWLAAPAFSPDRFTFHWLDVAAPVALGGLWLWAFTGQLQKSPLLPVREPYLKEALGHV